MTTRRRALPLVLSVVLLLADALAAPRALAAQALRVRIAEEGTGTPLAGALASALDGAGRTAGEGVTSPDGRGLIRLAAPGRYRILVRRIGYRPFTSHAIVVGAGDTVDVQLRVPPRHVVLSAVTTEAAPHCRIRGDDRSARGVPRLATLWDQISTALLVGELTRRDGAPAVAARSFERRLDADGGLLDIAVGPAWRSETRPFHAREPAELSHLGYVRRRAGITDFFAPDERVLLSDEFWRDHCFGVVVGRGPTAGLVGVHFAPARARRVPEIEGVLWADSATAELRHLDFWHVDPDLPRAARGPGRTGGQIVFERLPSGAWVVAAWRMRMPRLVQVARPFNIGAVQLRGYDEVGGVTLPADGATPAPLVAAYLREIAPGRVVGTARDDAAGAPLEGALATLWPLPLGAGLAPESLAVLVDHDGAAAVAETHRDQLVTLVDAAGRFALDSVPPGHWLVEVTRADLDSAGIAPTPRVLLVRPGATARAALAVPPATSADAWCGTRDDGRGVVHGIVRDADDRALVGNAVVLVSWTEIVEAPSRGRASVRVEHRRLEALSDERGAYRLCGVPAERSLTVQAFGGRLASGPVDAALGARRMVRRDFALALADSTTLGVGRAIVAGSVRDSAGAPLPDAIVEVVGALAEGRTDSAGRFVLAGLPAGTQTIEVRQIGHAPLRRAVTLRNSDTTRVGFRLVRAPILEEVVVEAPRDRPSWRLTQMEERHEKGLGRQIFREEIHRHPQLRSVFEAVPGLRIVMPPPPPLPAPQLLPDGHWSPWVVVMNRGFSICVPTFYLDGRLLPAHDVPSLHPRNLAGVEVFSRSTTAPVDLNGGERACAVILLWTEQAP
ncbi:MAG TPA: carboxypeptidase-like regulatory domain-containing protein [Gemmatimonadaceae bacterium]